MSARSGHPRPPLPAGPYLVVGLARSGVAAATLLARRGERVFGVDSGRPDPDPSEGLCALGVEVSLDDPGLKLLDGVNAVVKSPGVPADAPVIVAARERGVPVLGELELGWRLISNRFIAVTGTNGKTTVAEWLGHVFRAAGRPVDVAGNVGTPLTALVDQVGSGIEIVCECSSFQLEDSVAFAPEVAILLNVSPDHLDRHETLDAYRAAKLRVFANQGPDDHAVFDLDDPVCDIPGDAGMASYGVEACESDPACLVYLRDAVIEADGEPLVEAAEVALPGLHNLRNAMAVTAAALSAGIPRDAIAKGLTDFAGVPHRLERVAEIAAVSFVNDSKATNVAAAIAAINSFSGGVRVILGGSLKGDRFTELIPAVAAQCSACYLIGAAASALADDLAGADVPLHQSGDLATALAAASADAVAGDVVLLAPACASFDQFPDYEQRGELFRQLVRELVEARR